MRRSSSPALGVAVAFACLVGATSCDTPLEPDANGVDQIVLTPSSASLQAGETVTLTALVLDAGGNAMRDRKVVWSTENASIATVSQSGVVTGVAAGSVQIAGSSGGKSASADITVTARPVSLVRVTPGSATVSVSGSLTLSAEALDASGAPVLGRPVVWSSSNDAIAIVSNTGIVAGISPGSVTITAMIDGRAGTAAITVSPQAVESVAITPEADTIVVGRRVTLRASAFGANNTPLANRTTVWTSSDPTIATVSSSGEVLALSVGTARIRATIEGKFAEATILVRPIPVANVVVTPSQVSLNPGQTSQLTVTLSDSSGNVLTGRTITYESSNASIATVTAGGLVTAVAEGSAQITVTSEGKTGTAVVTVNPVPVASIRVSPNAVTLRLGQTIRLSAQAFDAQGRPLANRRFTWISGAAAVASVNQSGDVTAVSTGTASIFAATEGISASASISVTSVPVKNIIITPGSLSLQTGASAQLSAATVDSAGGNLPGRVVTWSSSADAIAVVSSTGRVTAVATGTASITATSEGVAASVGVTVSNVPVATVTVTPANPTLGVGQTLGMTATMRDAGGNILSGRAVTWSTSAANTVSVDAQGVVTAVASGSATITATSEGRTGSTLVTVSAIPVARVDVTPTTVSLNPGQTSQLTATAYDANNNVLSRPITWSSNNTTVATVSTSGLVTAVQAGSATISATSGGVTGTALVTVALVPVSSVTVTPGAPNMFPNDALQLTATARDASGNVITGRPTTWNTSNQNVATVSTSGLVTAITTGAATITATVDGVSGTSTVTISQTPVASVTLAPASASLLQGEQTGFIATARDAGGNPLSRQITWSTTSPAVVVNVTQGGVVTAINPGTEGVIATAVGAGAGGADVADTATVTVSLVPVASVTIAPKPSITLLVSQSGQLTVQLFDSAGGSLSTTGRNITWTSRDPSVASVSASGLLTAVGAGNTRIVVSTPGASATVADSTNVTVNPSPVTSVAMQPGSDAVYQGATRSLRAVLRDALNQIVRNQPVSWSSKNPAIASVSPVAAVPDSATYTGVGVGSTYIIATSPSGPRDSSLVTVSLVPVTSVTVTPATVSIDLTNTSQLTATPLDSAGNPLTRTITWSSSNQSVASVSTSGLVTANAGGSATIEARAVGAGVNGADVFSTAAVTVNVPVNSVTVTSPRSFIVPNDTTHLTVVLRDALNNLIDPATRTITYGSSDNAIASAAAGPSPGIAVVTGAGTGSVTITVSSEGKNGTVGLTGTAGVFSVAIACTSAFPACANQSDATFVVSTSKTYTITVTDPSGNPLSGKVLAVSNSNSTAFTVNPATTVTTDAAGQATVTVTAGTTANQSSTITFTSAAREGAIPPGTAGNNAQTGSITVTIP